MTHATAIKPLKPPGQQPQAPERDHAKNGFSLYALEQLVRDCEGQPDWRPRADTAHAYYDFKQLSPEQQHRIRRDMGIDPRQTNLIHGVVNGVLGQEAARRTDVKLEADDDALADLCDVFSKSMKEARRESYADMAISNAYAGQVKGGIGWVEVSRASDPLDYPYRVTDIHRNEIWYDWRAKDLGLRDARWLVRKRWQDLDEAVAMLPQYTDLLQRVVNGWDVLSLPDDVENFYYRSYNNERRTTIRRDEWLDSDPPAREVLRGLVPRARGSGGDAGQPHAPHRLRCPEPAAPGSRRQGPRSAFQVCHASGAHGLVRRSAPARGRRHHQAQLPLHPVLRLPRRRGQEPVRPHRGDDQPAGRVQRAPPDDPLDAARPADSGRLRRPGHRVQQPDRRPRRRSHRARTSWR
jgi:hypothetical protein